MSVKRIALAIVVMTLVTAVPVFSRERVAVIDFAAKDVDESDAVAVSDLFRSDLVAAGNYIVLERGNMKSILAEHELQMTGVINEASATEIGELLAVNYLFLGNLSKFGNNFILVIDKINVETGEIQKSVKKTAVNIDSFLELSAEAAVELSDTEGIGIAAAPGADLYDAETLTQLMEQINIFNLFELTSLKLNTQNMQQTDLGLRRNVYNDFELDNATLCMIVNAVTFGIGGNFMQGFNEYGILAIATTSLFAGSLLFTDSLGLKITFGALWFLSYGGSIVTPFMYEAEYNQYLKDSLLVY